MDHNIHFIDQRLTQHRSLILKCKAQSTATKKRFGNEIIALEIKRIEVTHALKKIDLPSYEPSSQYIKPDTQHASMCSPSK